MSALTVSPKSDFVVLPKSWPAQHGNIVSTNGLSLRWDFLSFCPMTDRGNVQETFEKTAALFEEMTHCIFKVLAAVIVHSKSKVLCIKCLLFLIMSGTGSVGFNKGLRSGISALACLYSLHDQIFTRSLYTTKLRWFMQIQACKCKNIYFLFLSKDHVTLKTGVTMLKIQLCTTGIFFYIYI